MTDETPNPSETDADAQAKRAALEAEATKRDIKFDKRFSDKRISDMIEEWDGKNAVSQAAPAPNARAPQPEPESAVSANQTEGFDENAALRAELAALEAEEIRAKIAAKRASIAAVTAEAAPVDKPNLPPANMLTMSSTHDAQEAERNDLLAQVNELGIAMALPKNPSNDAIRATIQNHVAAKAAAQAILDEQDRQAALAGPAEMVKVRILPMGSGKLSRGVHIPAKGDSTYMYGESAILELAVAQANVALGYVEIIHE